MRSSTRLLYLLHLVGNALALWIGYLWLSVPESDTTHLLGSALMAVLCVCFMLCLHGSAFVFFRQAPRPSLVQTAKVVMRHIPALIVLAFVVVLAYVEMQRVHDVLGAPAFKLASYLTMTFRKPVPPDRILAFFFGLIWLLRWFVLPAIFVPVASAAAVSGFRGFRQMVRKPKVTTSFIIFGLVLAAIWLPGKLLAWVPPTPNFSMEVVSFVLRSSAAYLLFAGSLLLLERTTASGIPDLSQRSTSTVP